MAGKILFVASTRSHIRTFHLPYLKALQEDGFTIHGAWGGTEGEVPHVDEIICLPFEKQMTSLKNFRIPHILRRRMKTEQYDCVIVHTSLAAFFTRLALIGLKHRPKVINMVHGYLFDDQTSWPKRMLLLAAEKLTAPVTDLLLTMNEWDYQTAAKHRLGKKIVNIPGIGVDYDCLDSQRARFRPELRQSLGLTDEDFVLIYPAEFSPRKSQHILIRTMVNLPDSIKLILPGSGALLDDCKSLAAELGVSSRILFPGYITEMGAWYEMADAAVSSSRSEGLPFNIMEAMHCGLPVIASIAKGHVDLISYGHNGYLYPYGNHILCAAQIQRLLDDQVCAAALAKQAKIDVDKYSLSEVFPCVMAQYHSILKSPTIQ